MPLLVSAISLYLVISSAMLLLVWPPLSLRSGSAMAALPRALEISFVSLWASPVRALSLRVRPALLPRSRKA